MKIAFIDLAAQRARMGRGLEEAITSVVRSGAYIQGPQVRELEDKLSEITGAARTLSCGNGTDALVLSLMALGVGRGDAVFVPSFSFAATAEAPALVGAVPVFVDTIRDTYCMDAAHLDAAIDAVAREGKLKPKAIIAVDLFGQLADYPNIEVVARRRGLKLISDCAQAFGATLHGAHAIKWADLVTTSFYPAKPLGCYGDGGAIQTNDAALADLIDSLRVHGQATARDLVQASFEHESKYLNLRVGLNSRLDTLQAAVLLEKLKIFADEIEEREAVAARYSQSLRDFAAATPKVSAGGRSVWAQYTIESLDRAGLAAYLKAVGAPTAVYYPVPLHKQRAFAGCPAGPGGLPVTEATAERVISLPMHAYLKPDEQDFIVSAIGEFENGRKRRNAAE